MRQQHILQSQVTHLLWELTYPRRPARSIVLQVNAGGCQATDTTPTSNSAARAALAALRAAAQRAAGDQST
jgi:hypothetical protein